MVHDVFMSYSRKDEATMKRIVAFLRSSGIKVWVDNEGLVPGTPIWEVEIERAIIDTKAIVVLMSPDSKNSVWVRQEIGYAQRYRKRIFPLLISGDEDSSVTIRLINTQHIDLRQRERTGLRSLSDALKNYIKEYEEKGKLLSSGKNKNLGVSQQPTLSNSANETLISNELNLITPYYRRLFTAIIILTAIISACSLILSITRLF